MRDGKDDGRKALSILWEHYRGSGKQRIISLYTTLTTLQKGKDEDLTSYIIRAENAATALKAAGSIVEDALLIAMILKGLPPVYKPFTVFVTQQDKAWTFLAFKTAIRNFEENERASMDSITTNFDNIMAFRGQPTGNGGQNNGGQIICHGCGKEGHKSFECPDKSRNDRGENPRKQKGKNSKWCNNCKKNTHNTSECRNKNRNGKDSAKHVGHGEQDRNSKPSHSFVLALSERKKPEKQPPIPVVEEEIIPVSAVIETRYDDEMKVLEEFDSRNDRKEED